MNALAAGNASVSSLEARAALKDLRKLLNTPLPARRARAARLERALMLIEDAAESAPSIPDTQTLPLFTTLGEKNG